MRLISFLLQTKGRANYEKARYQEGEGRRDERYQEHNKRAQAAWLSRKMVDRWVNPDTVSVFHALGREEDQIFVNE